MASNRRVRSRIAFRLKAGLRTRRQFFLAETDSTSANHGLIIEYWKLKNANWCGGIGGVTCHLKHRLHAIRSRTKSLRSPTATRSQRTARHRGAHAGSMRRANREPQRGSSSTDAGAATPLGLFVRSGENPGWRCLAALVADPGLGALTPLASNRMLRAVESHSA